MKSETNPGIGEVVRGFHWGKIQEANDRYKVLLDTVIQSSIAIGLLGFALEGVTKLSKVSRVSAKCLMTKNSLNSWNKFPFNKLLKVEGVIPLDIKDESGQEIVYSYLGNQTNNRKLSKQINNGLDELIKKWGVEKEKIGSYWNNPAKLPANVTSPEEIDINSASVHDLKDLSLVLKESFDKYLIDPSDLEKLKNFYSSPNTKLFVIRDSESHIIAMTAIDLSTVNSGNNKIIMAELTDFATIDDWRKKGLNSILRAAAIKKALYNYSADVVFVESNALSGGANRGNILMGLPYVGRLPYSCILAADPTTENGEHGTLRSQFPKKFKNMAPLNIYGASAHSLKKFVH